MTSRAVALGKAATVALASALALAWALPSGSVAAGSSELALSLAAKPATPTFGESYAVEGTLAEGGAAVPGRAVVLQADPYPFHGFATVASIGSAANGRFAFAGIRAEADTRLRVLAVAGGGETRSSAVLPVEVAPRVAVNVRSASAGRTLLSIRLDHATSAARSSSGTASWFVAAAGSHDFQLLARTPTRELSPGLTYAKAVVDPPSARFRYRVCLNPPWRAAMSRPRSGACPRGDYAYGGEGRGIPLAAYPSPAAIAGAARYLDGRAGRTSFAVIDSSGRLSGVRVHARFQSASVVKVMFLVAYLQMRAAQHRDLDAADTSLLYPMIHISDNEAASAVLAAVGGAAVARVASESGMSDYAPGVGWWAYTQTSAADQARFFYELPSLVPGRFWGYARGLLEGIEPSQSWGFPPVARPRWQVLFKTGALPSEGLFNETALMERPGLSFTVSVFTEGDPSMSYGEQTIEGLAATLLAHEP